MTRSLRGAQAAVPVIEPDPVSGLGIFPNAARRVLLRVLMARREAMKTYRVRRIAERVTATVREMNEAQQRMMALRMAADRYLINPDTPPDTYAEFLMRTSGPLLREPSAAKRAATR
jgi:hypothetical protein